MNAVFLWQMNLSAVDMSLPFIFFFNIMDYGFNCSYFSSPFTLLIYWSKTTFIPLCMFIFWLFSLFLFHTDILANQTSLWAQSMQTPFWHLLMGKIWLKYLPYTAFLFLFANQSANKTSSQFVFFPTIILNLSSPECLSHTPPLPFEVFPVHYLQQSSRP